MIILTACGEKQIDFVVRDMRFLLPYSVTPIRDTITLNDTLNFTMQFPDNVLELSSNQRYKMKNFDWGLFLAFSKISDSTKTIGLQPVANNSFSYLSTYGSFQNPRSTGVDIKLIYANNEYKMVGKIKPLQRSTYNMFIGPSKRSDNGIPDSVLSLPNTMNGQRQILSYKIPDEIVNNGANNFYLLKANAYLGNPIVDSVWRGTYTL